MLFRALVWIVLAYILWRAGSAFYRQVHKNYQQRQAPTRSIASIPMVRCQRCGLHIPQQEALNVNDHYYCCEAHKQASLNDY